MRQSLFALSLFSLSSSALRVPFDVYTNSHLPSTSLTRRSPYPIANTGNAQYVTNITLGGANVRVLLDTGSSDLWASFPSQQPSLTDLGKSVSLSYAVGKVQGQVAATTLEFGSYKIDNQAFLYVKDTSSFTSDIHLQGYDGLLGLGPNAGSLVRKQIKGDARGDTMLTHIFQTHNLTDNYISFLLDRKGDPNDPFKGQLTVSEIVPGFENITVMPKMDIDTVNRLLKADQHWQILTDKDNGIIGPDGQPLKVDSIVPGCPDGQLVAVIDSGFTFSQVPRDISDQIYGRVKGAYYDSVQEFWMIPCEQELNITFNFGGKSYPVHPLDTVDDNFNQVDSTGKKVCFGAFQPITSAFSLLGHYDMILGMSFLRNAYTLLDFGNWIDIASQKQDHPYVQLASVTSAPQAHREFIQVRLGGVDTSGDDRYKLLPQEQMQRSPVSDEEKKKKYQEMILSRWPYIFVGCLVFTLGLIGFCVWRCCCKNRRGKKGAAANNGVFGRFFNKNGTRGGMEEGEFGAGAKAGKVHDESSTYLPLSTPDNNLSMHSLHHGSQQPYQYQQQLQHQQQHQQSYPNAQMQWDNNSSYSLQHPYNQTYAPPYHEQHQPQRGEGQSAYMQQGGYAR